MIQIGKGGKLQVSERRSGSALSGKRSVDRIVVALLSFNTLASSVTWFFKLGSASRPDIAIGRIPGLVQASSLWKMAWLSPDTRTKGSRAVHNTTLSFARINPLNSASRSRHAELPRAPRSELPTTPHWPWPSKRTCQRKKKSFPRCHTMAAAESLDDSG